MALTTFTVVSVNKN